MKKKTKLIIGIIFLSIIILFVIAYFSNSLALFGLCKPGTKLGRGGFGQRFCYIPSGFEEQPCDKKTDCGTGECFLVDPNKTIGKGICRDLPYGCNVRIDENGNFDEKEVLCVD